MNELTGLGFRNFLELIASFKTYHTSIDGAGKLGSSREAIISQVTIISSFLRGARSILNVEKIRSYVHLQSNNMDPSLHSRLCTMKVV